MARKYKLITLEDRRKIERAYYNGAAPGAIAAEVGASLSSIYREIARGRVSLQRNCNLSLLQASLSDRLARAAHEGGQ